MNKGIFILGSAASGKSTLIKDLDFGEINIWNQDVWVENNHSPFYNNPLSASKHLYNRILPKRMERGEWFVLDTTGSNIKTLRKIIDTPNYQFKAVVVYCNPIITFIRNFNRERKLPKQVLLENWLKVYSQIEEYIDMFGRDNIYIYETEYTDEEQEIIKKFEDDTQDLVTFLILLRLDTTSTFKKESTLYTPEEKDKKISKFIEICNKIETGIDKIENIIIEEQFIGFGKEDIKKELNEWINQ